MVILMDCVKSLWAGKRPRVHCPVFSSEMAALLEDLVCLFNDNRSDLEKIFTFRDSPVMSHVMAMEKAGLDLKEVVEVCLEEEEKKVNAIKDLNEQVAHYKSKNLDLEERINRLQKQLADADSELSMMGKDNRALAHECDQKRYEIERLYDELSHLQKVNCKLENCKDDLNHINKRLEDTIKVNMALEADHRVLLDHNHELVREADAEHAEVLRLKSLEEDARLKVQAVNYFEFSSKRVYESRSKSCRNGNRNLMTW